MIRNVKLGSVAIEAKASVSSIPPGTPIVGLEHLDPGELTLSRWDITDKTTFTKTFKKGDVLFGRRRAYLKKAAMAPFDGVCSGDITVIRAMPNKIRPGLLAFLIQNDRFFAHAVKNSDGSLSPRAKWASLKEFAFALDDDLSVQDRILDMLVSINNTKLKYKIVLAKCDELIKSRFIEAFGNCPQKPIGSIFQTKSGGTPSTKVDEYYHNGNVPWLTSSEIHQGYIEKPHNFITTLGMENSSAKMVPAESVVIAMYGATVGTVGLLKYASTMNQAICALLPNDLFEPLFVFHSLSALKDTFLEQTVGGGQPNISQIIIKKTLFPVPPLAQQKEFIGFAAQIDKLKFPYYQAKPEVIFYA